MSVIEINSPEEFQVEGNPILVDFSAKWCGPCRMMLPKLKQIAKDYPEITVCKVDADRCQSIVSEFKINALPTFVFLVNDEEVHRIEGADPQGLIDYCDKLVTPSDDEEDE